LAGNGIVSSIIGIGLNVNNEKLPNLPQATSLYLMENRKFDLDKVLDELTRAILFQIEKLNPDESELLKSEYETRLFRRNQVSVFEGRSLMPSYVEYHQKENCFWNMKTKYFDPIRSRKLNCSTR